MSLTLSPLLERIRPILTAQSQPVYLVGGAVRDALLGRTSHDLDFAVADGAVKLAFKVANSLGVPAYVMDRERDVGRVVLANEGTTFDFTRFRGEHLEADLRDRDFTINAIALAVGELGMVELVDPTGGRADLDAGLVRQVHDKALIDDPVRALRAIRIAVSLGFDISAETEAAVASAAARFNKVSVERVRDELLKLLTSHAPEEALDYMARLSVLRAVLPEIDQLRGVEQSAPHYEDVYDHTCSVLGWLARLEATLLDGRLADQSAVVEVEEGLAPYLSELRAHWQRPVTGALNGRTLLRLGALFHDCGKAVTQTVEESGKIRFIGHDKAGAKLAMGRLRHFRLSNEAINHVGLIVGHHMRPLYLEKERVKKPLSRRAIFRFFRAAESAGLDVGLLALADNLATYDGRDEDGVRSRMLATVIELYGHYFQQYETTVRPPLLLDGNQLMRALGLGPSREIGRLLELIQEAQAAGEISSRSEAVELARKHLK